MEEGDGYANGRRRREKVEMEEEGVGYANGRGEKRRIQFFMCVLRFDFISALISFE